MLIGFLLLLGGLFLMYWGYTQLITPANVTVSPTSTSAIGNSLSSGNA